MNELLRSSIEQGVTPELMLAPGQSTSFLNPFSYLLLRGRPDLLDAIRHWAIDGKSLQVLLARAWGADIRRASFDYTSLADPVFGGLARRGGSLFVLGSDAGSIERFVQHLRDGYPSLRIAGYRNGFFAGDDERRAEARRIVALGPDFVLVGMGAVRQEEFVRMLFEEGFQGAAATCGGFIHQTARSGARYYPAWVDRFNLRFAYRMFDEPALVRRYAIDYPRAFMAIRRDLRALAKAGRPTSRSQMEKSS